MVRCMFVLPVKMPLKTLMSHIRVSGFNTWLQLPASAEPERYWWWLKYLGFCHIPRRPGFCSLASSCGPSFTFHRHFWELTSKWMPSVSVIKKGCSYWLWVITVSHVLQLTQAKEPVCSAAWVSSWLIYSSYKFILLVETKPGVCLGYKGAWQRLFYVSYLC